MKITNISVTNHGGFRYAISWETADARFHVWGTLNAAGRMTWEETIYKNPVVITRDQQTRRLNRHAAANVPAIDIVILACAAGRMIEKADAAYEAERQEALAEAKASKHHHRIKETGPELLAALQSVLSWIDAAGIEKFPAFAGADIRPLSAARKLVATLQS